MERDGGVDPDGDFGLLLYDRATNQVSRATAGSVKVADRPIIFVHGMTGGVETFRGLLAAFGKQRELTRRKLLVFRYPGNASLARSGRFLASEVRRAITAANKATFVCHSAGGLVFRYYAERLKSKFEHAVLIATPHAGSDLTQLKFLVDLTEFALGTVARGPVRALATAIPEGKGEIGLDLHPDSLFLRGLGRDRRLAARYHLVVGQYLSPSQALGLRLTFAASRRYLLTRAIPVLPDGVFKTHADRWAGQLRLPLEVLRGDLVVTTVSATLPGAGRVTKLPLHHLTMRTDPKAISVVLDSVLGEVGR
jgi:pimeloyl-ACP methyl ester carboxylesterase